MRSLFTARLVSGLLFAALSAPLLAQIPSAVGQLPITPEDLEGEVTPQQEHRHRVDRARAIEALDESLFGDSINAYTGAVQFSVTDISIPGNSALAVEMRRRFDPNDVRGHGTNIRSGHVFEDWDLDLPHLHGVFAATTGWQAGAVAGVRCNQPNAAQSAPPQIGAVEPDDYWQGNQLYVPDRGDDEIMHLAASSPDRPTDGLGYQWATKGLWYFSCLTSTANGVSGDAFLARDPEGNKYWFNQIVEKLYAPITRGGSSSFARREILILPTRIEDRFGNWVEYTWSPTQPRNLTKIASNDGRQIDIAYETSGGPGGRILSASVGARTWAYAYTGPLIRGTLNTVTRPDTSKYTYDFSTFHEDHADLAFSGCGGSPGFIYAMDFVASIAHPSGAVGTFTFKYQRHGRTYVPQNCWSDSFDSGDRFPKIFTVLSLTKKRIEGNGLPAPMEWQWTYPDLTSGYTHECTPSCPTTKIVETIRPDGSIEKQTYGIRYGNNDGLLMGSEILQGGSPLRTTTFDHRFDPAGQLYLPRVADPIRRYPDASIGVFKPRVSQIIAQQGATFSSLVKSTAGVYSFDRFARQLQSTSASSLGFSANRTQTYFDHSALWVLGQSATTEVDGITASASTYDPNTALPLTKTVFGRLDRSFEWHPDGTLWKQKDALDRAYVMTGYDRGIPTAIVLPTNSAHQMSTTVDDFGNVESVTDPVGFTTAYEYDAMNRLTSTSYPSGDSVAWVPTLTSFAPTTINEHDIPLGLWARTEIIGTHTKKTWFDALWRPILERDAAADGSASPRFARRTYDHKNRETFSSYPQDALAGYTTATTGVRTYYDALGRTVRTEADSELSGGALTTIFEYLPGFLTRRTDPRGELTTTSFQAWDNPTDEFPREIQAPEGQTTLITRDVFGKPIRMTRSGVYAGNSVSVDRDFVYDAQQRLCKAVEPESGSTIVDYDSVNDVAWTAIGQNLPGLASCDRELVPGDGTGSQRSSHSYDAMHRLLTIDHPVGTADVGFTYFADGALESASSAGSVWTYTYNKRRLLESESLSFDSRLFDLDWAYNTRGQLQSLTYPSTPSGALLVDFNPDARGQAREAGSFATVVNRHANGAIKNLTYGNLLTLATTQNLRQLTATRVVGSILNYTLGYDRNANLTSVVDGTAGAVESRVLAYDGLNRMTQANAPAIFGNETYVYDPLDNVRQTQFGATIFVHQFDANNQLDQINLGSQPFLDYASNNQGDTIRRDRVLADELFADGFESALVSVGATMVADIAPTQELTYDRAHRLTGVANIEQYSYDAHGHRVVTIRTSDGLKRYQIYSRTGQLVFTQDHRNNEIVDYVSIDGGFVSERAQPIAGGSLTITYLHTDMRGSPVIESDGAGVPRPRTVFEPYGPPADGQYQDGPGFTGHATDASTGLSYMQQRYYDPIAGRFLSVDPVGPSSDGDNFNRHWYANNNPYKFIDPDGRQSRDFEAEAKLARLLGKAQESRNTPTHGITSSRLAVEAMQKSDTRSVHLNQSLRTVTGDPGAPNIRPDVTVVRTTGEIDMKEVRSAGQTTGELVSKLSTARSQLGVPGRNIVVEPDLPSRGMRIPGVLGPIGLLHMIFHEATEQELSRRQLQEYGARPCASRDDCA